MASLTRTSRSRPRPTSASAGPERIPVRVAALLDVLGVDRQAVDPLRRTRHRASRGPSRCDPTPGRSGCRGRSSPARSSGGMRTAPRRPRRRRRPGITVRFGSRRITASSTTSSTTTITRSAANATSFWHPSRPQICASPRRVGALRVHDRDVGLQRRHDVHLGRRRRRARSSARSSGSPTGCRTRSSCGSGRTAGSTRRPCTGTPSRSASTPRSRAAPGRPSRSGDGPRAAIPRPGCRAS